MMATVKVDPFQAPPSADPSADTLSSAVEQTTPPAGPTWTVRTVATLRQVEDLLDSLEAHGVAEKEVIALQDNLFAVRWR